MTIDDRISEEAAALRCGWETDDRWQGIQRDYTAEEVIRLRGSVRVEHSVALAGAGHPPHRLDGPDRRRRRGRLRRCAERLRADEVHDRGGRRRRALRGSTRVGEEVRPHGRQGPGPHRAARPHAGRRPARGRRPRHADAAGGPHRLARRDAAHQRRRLTDEPFVTGDRTVEGFHQVRSGMEPAVARGLAYAPYADLLWLETSTPDLDEAATFAGAIHDRFPGKLLAYNRSPSFNWRRHLDDAPIGKFQKELGRMGYRFQFVTLAGFHALNASMFELANGYATDGMTAYVQLQQREFDLEQSGYTATRHQREVGAGYFDQVSQVISGGTASTLALRGSTEEEQFAGV